MGAEVGRGSLVDGRTFWVRPVSSWVLESNNVVAEAMAVSLYPTWVEHTIRE